MTTRCVEIEGSRLYIADGEEAARQSPRSCYVCEAQLTQVELSAKNGVMFFTPEGFAHGFQTLSGNTEIFYQVSAYYAPESVRGLRWNDPAFRIQWPEDDRTIIARDSEYPDFDPAAV